MFAHSEMTWAFASPDIVVLMRSNQIHGRRCQMITQLAGNPSRTTSLGGCKPTIVTCHGGGLTTKAIPLVAGLLSHYAGSRPHVFSLALSLSAKASFVPLLLAPSA